MASCALIEGLRFWAQGGVGPGTPGEGMGKVLQRGHGADGVEQAAALPYEIDLKLAVIHDASSQSKDILNYILSIGRPDVNVLNSFVRPHRSACFHA